MVQVYDYMDWLWKTGLGRVFNWIQEANNPYEIQAQNSCDIDTSTGGRIFQMRLIRCGETEETWRFCRSDSGKQIYVSLSILNYFKRLKPEAQVQPGSLLLFLSPSWKGKHPVEWLEQLCSKAAEDKFWNVTSQCVKNFGQCLSW